jgi:hypothetical protein
MRSRNLATTATVWEALASRCANVSDLAFAIALCLSRFVWSREARQSRLDQFAMLVRAEMPALEGT